MKAKNLIIGYILKFFGLTLLCLHALSYLAVFIIQLYFKRGKIISLENTNISNSDGTINPNLTFAYREEYCSQNLLMEFFNKADIVYFILPLIGYAVIVALGYTLIKKALFAQKNSI